MSETYWYRICTECKTEFKSEQKFKRFCPECLARHCKACWQREQKSTKALKPKPKKKVEKPKYTIGKICAIQERYNKEHNTFLHYGDIVKLIEEGSINTKTLRGGRND